MKGAENVSPDWGPDGRLAFSTRIEGLYRVSVLDPETREDRVYGTDSADYEDPSWAPDGRHIACTRTERFRSDIYVLDTVEDAFLRLTTESGEWYAPAWSP